MKRSELKAIVMAVMAPVASGSELNSQSINFLDINAESILNKCDLSDDEAVGPVPE